MALANARGVCAGRIRRTIKEEKIDLSEHEDYTAACRELALTFAESGSPRITSPVVSTLAKFESQRHTRRLEEGSS
ncbi:MAG TPA: hypothetical protein VLY63_16345 [Anaerolineae bacterium]|nr:hypothetical protein [Anaerolineae bacterium]